MELNVLLNGLIEEGLAGYGFACVKGLSHPRYAHLPYAVSLVFKLSDAVLDEVETGQKPTFSYFQHYRTVNAYLDSCTLRVAALLEREGYKAMPVAASQTVHDLGGTFMGIFPHKTAAVLAGLGWIGRSTLFIAPGAGPRVRLATVLTDKMLTADHEPPPAPPSRCGSCSACVQACPAHAITGEDFVSGTPRGIMFDAQACSAHMRSAYMEIGRGAVCGICAAVCKFR